NLILASPSRDDENADDVVLYTSLPSSLETGDDLVLLTRKSTGKLDLAGRPRPTVPSSTAEALAGPYSPEWRSGMVEEFNGFKTQDAYGLVKRRPGMNVLGSRWHHSIRSDDEGDPTQLKSRLVIQGCKTIPFLADYGATFAPLPNLGIVMSFFALSAHKGWEIWCTDFFKGYLAARIAAGEEPIYAKQPPGFEEPGKEDWVMQLNRAAYGLPQSGRQLHLLVKEFCEDVDYLPISEEVSFYLGEKDGKEAAFLIYVDDGL
ncbi:hypothetical protein JCM10213_008728, partial [Rhodosporidiobolus nylandii]